MYAGTYAELTKQPVNTLTDRVKKIRRSIPVHGHTYQPVYRHTEQPPTTVSTPAIGVSGPTGSPTAEEVPKCKPVARVGTCLISSRKHSLNWKTYPSESDPVYFNEPKV